jgi:hypothetical protein
MSGWKKLAAASAAGGDVLNVEDLFSTYLYDGNSSNRSITNGIDLSTEGGLVWIKGRTSTTYDFNNTLFDTERGAGYRISTDGTDYQRYNNNTLTSFNTDGFSLGTDGSLLVNWSSNDYVSWTFRKAPKFFDVVTYTGDGTTPQTINHNLGVEPGCIIIKRTDGGITNWWVYHRGLNNGVNPEQYAIQLNLTSAQGGDAWNDTAPTSTEFTVTGGQQVGGSGMTYVAYLFAHHDGDGDFGPTGDQDIIKCGSYSGTGASGNSVDLGFEPQWIMTRRTNVIGSNSYLWDVTRGMYDDGSVGICQRLEANSDNKERVSEGPTITSNGFVLNSTSSDTNGNNDEYIYIAIRRGDMAEPENASDVFAISTQAETSAKYGYYAGFPVDMAWKNINTGEGGINTARIMGAYNLRLNNTDAQSSDIYAKFDDMVSYYNQTSVATNRYSWMFKRAAGFFDVVAWKGSSASTRTLNHSLGVAPEMIWAKNRNDTDPWYCYHTATGNTKSIPFSASTPVTSSAIWNNTTPSATTFSVGNNLNWSTSFNYIAYLFATVAGVSKVGSYTGNGSSQTIDCGFNSGASFVLVKRTDAGGNWTYWDTKRGIVAGNDTSAKINGTAGFVSDFDDIDPTSSGFIINQNSDTNFNVSSATYVFYAIAAI